MQELPSFLINHWVLTTLLITFIFLIIANSMKQKLLGFDELTPVDTIALMNKREEALLLDVRDTSDFNKGHILNAVNAPLGLLETKINELDQAKETPIITCCNNGQQSAKAAAELQKLGYESLYKLKGGILSWQGASLPLTKN